MNVIALKLSLLPLDEADVAAWVKMEDMPSVSMRTPRYLTWWSMRPMISIEPSGIMRTTVQQTTQSPSVFCFRAHDGMREGGGVPRSPVRYARVPSGSVINAFAVASGR